MKRGILSLMLLFVFIVGSAQNRKDVVCRLGFTYEMSQNSFWGKNKPVVMSVFPYTSAEQAGVLQYDIIDEIDGVNTSLLTPEEISQLLYSSEKNDVLLTIRNLKDDARHLLVKKEYKKINAITEDQLASAFSMYSLETTNEQEFSCPFRITVSPDPVELSLFKTFAFSAVDENNRRLETAINDAIEKELTKKGLKVNAEQPDLLIQTFYFFDKNPNYTGQNKVVVSHEPVRRYNFTRSKMEVFPFLSSAAAEAEAEYLLQFGFRLIDQRVIPGRVLWECEASELMADSYRLDDYARIHVPLMCMQYPYVKNTQNMTFRITKRSYNYTGIDYDIDRLEQVVDVDPNSPAQASGIRPRDIIERIGNHELCYSAEEFTAAYKQFVYSTIEYRDAKTRFKDINGFKYCMFWDPAKYVQVADAIQNPAYLPAFSYLYNFAPYVNPVDNNTCVFNVRRGETKLEFIIRPTIRSEVMIEVQ